MLDPTQPNTHNTGQYLDTERRNNDQWGHAYTAEVDGTRFAIYTWFFHHVAAMPDRAATEADKIIERHFPHAQYDTNRVIWPQRWGFLMRVEFTEHPKRTGPLSWRSPDGQFLVAMEPRPAQDGNGIWALYAWDDDDGEWNHNLIIYAHDEDIEKPLETIATDLVASYKRERGIA